MKQTKRTVRSLCIETRERIIDFAHNMPGSYKRKFPYVSDTLDCWCAISSVMLQRVLAKHGYPAMIVTGIFDETGEPYTSKIECINHSWVESPTQILDITVSQFNKKLDEVMIVDLGDPRWNRKHINQFRGWPPDQSPIRQGAFDKIEMILRHEFG